jgi:hypothetical protein
LLPATLRITFIFVIESFRHRANADHWLRLQTAFELAEARRHEDRIAVERYEPRPAA